MENKKIKFRCDKCGKEQIPDEEKSTENWTVYDNKEKCECGGEFKMSFKN